MSSFGGGLVLTTFVELAYCIVGDKSKRKGLLYRFQALSIVEDLNLLKENKIFKS